MAENRNLQKMIKSGAFINGYTFHGLIGSGGEGEVYLVESERYAMKFVAKVGIKKQGHDLEHEKQILMQITHPRILHVYDFFEDHGKYYLILEYIDSGNLLMEIRKRGKLSIERFFQVALELTDAVAYLHDQKHVAHRDIKPANILVNSRGHIKLCDFGISTIDEYECRHYGGSKAFIPPEVLTVRPYDPIQADIWSLGITFVYMLTGTIPWAGGLVHMPFYYQLPSFVSAKLPQTIVSILLKMIVYDPAQRLPAREIYNLLKKEADAYSEVQPINRHPLPPKIRTFASSITRGKLSVLTVTKTKQQRSAEW